MLINDEELFGGIHKIYRFPNNYGASVVRHKFSYGGNKGLFELAVLFFDGNDFEITYNTPITEGVIGYLTESEMEEYLIKIKLL